MTIDEIMTAFAEAKEYVLPREAIQAAVAMREEITPVLIAELDKALESYKAGELMEVCNWIVPSIAMTLLASFNETAAHERIANLMRMDEEHIDWFWSDSLCQEGARLLVSTDPGGPRTMQQLVEDEQAYEFARAESLLGLQAAVAHGLLSRETVVGYLTSLFRGAITREPSYIWNQMVFTAVDLVCAPLLVDVEKAYDEGLCEMMREPDIEEFIAVLSGNPPDLWQPQEVKLIRDAEAELAAWPYFKKPQPFPRRPLKVKIGRNDPCPCGSGKKHKKCCGMAG